MLSPSCPSGSRLRRRSIQGTRARGMGPALPLGALPARARGCREQLAADRISWLLRLRKGLEAELPGKPVLGCWSEFQLSRGPDFETPVCPARFDMFYSMFRHTFVVFKSISRRPAEALGEQHFLLPPLVECRSCFSTPTQNPPYLFLPPSSLHGCSVRPLSSQPAAFPVSCGWNWRNSAAQS